MPSADLEEAAKVATTARCQNNGQSCIAAKRFIVHADVYDEFAELFVGQMADQTLGDPMDDGTDIGPLATGQGRQDVAAAVTEAVEAGAKVLLGGEQPDGPGWWYPATVVSDVPEGTTMYDDEVFGPVAGLFKVAGYDEAVTLANDVPFGLGSNAWTNDAAEQEAFARDLDAGMVFVNGMTASYPSLPFGGVGTSGYGRELADLGIREFCNAKTVWVG
jgi:succinate-semialdehyde dehydrogenase/glutarate-semialdehyde dehydrogenase